MPRKRKDKKEEDRIKTRGRSFRNRERRQKRQKAPGDPYDFNWIKSHNVRMVANRIMNDSYREPAPFWLSVPKHPRPDPVDFYPCRSHERGNRIWYGFLFREHRDQQIILWGGRARKELTPE